MNPNLSSGAHGHLKSASGFQFTFVWMFWLYVCVSRSVVSDSFATPMDCSSPDSSVHGILQARILEVLISFSREPSQPRIKPSPNPGLSHCMQIFFFLPFEPPGKPFNCTEPRKCWLTWLISNLLLVQFKIHLFERPVHAYNLIY